MEDRVEEGGEKKGQDIPQPQAIVYRYRDVKKRLKVENESKRDNVEKEEREDRTEHTSVYITFIQYLPHHPIMIMYLVYSIFPSITPPRQTTNHAR